MASMHLLEDIQYFCRQICFTSIERISYKTGATVLAQQPFVYSKCPQVPLQQELCFCHSPGEIVYTSIYVQVQYID